MSDEKEAQAIRLARFEAFGEAIEVVERVAEDVRRKQTGNAACVLTARDRIEELRSAAKPREPSSPGYPSCAECGGGPTVAHYCAACNDVIGVAMDRRDPSNASPDFFALARDWGVAEEDRLSLADKLREVYEMGQRRSGSAQSTASDLGADVLRLTGELRTVIAIVEPILDSERVKANTVAEGVAAALGIVERRASSAAPAVTCTQLDGYGVVCECCERRIRGLSTDYGVTYSALDNKGDEHDYAVGTTVRERTGDPTIFGRTGTVLETRLVRELRVDFGPRCTGWQRAEHCAPAPCARLETEQNTGSVSRDDSPLLIPDDRREPGGSRSPSDRRGPAPVAFTPDPKAGAAAHIPTTPVFIHDLLCPRCMRRHADHEQRAERGVFCDVYPAGPSSGPGDEIVAWLNGLESARESVVSGSCDAREVATMIARRGVYDGIAADIKRKWPALFTRPAEEKKT